MLDNISEVFIDLLEKDRERIFRDSPDSFSDIIADAVHTSLNLISRSDALYHDIEHTCLVTLCGQDIFLGKKLLEGQLNATDWLHYTLALLFHDIGYIRNLLKEDKIQGKFSVQLAYSGGIDSSCLLDVLTKLRSVFNFDIYITYIFLLHRSKM